MQKYRDYRPTGFDPAGLNADRYDIGEYYVVYGRNRDSDTLTESNWRSILRELGGESETVQVHRFGHWACGWFELIIVAPDTPEATTAQELADALENYPIISESDYSELEWERATEYLGTRVSP